MTLTVARFAAFAAMPEDRVREILAERGGFNASQGALHLMVAWDGERLQPGMTIPGQPAFIQGSGFEIYEDGKPTGRRTEWRAGFLKLDASLLKYRRRRTRARIKRPTPSSHDGFGTNFGASFGNS